VKFDVILLNDKSRLLERYRQKARGFLAETPPSCFKGDASISLINTGLAAPPAERSGEIGNQ
jgi:hypothetical protein